MVKVRELTLLLLSIALFPSTHRSLHHVPCTKLWQMPPGAREILTLMGPG